MQHLVTLSVTEEKLESQQKGGGGAGSPDRHHIDDRHYRNEYTEGENKGAPGAPLTRDASAALQRLDMRKPAPKE